MAGVRRFLGFWYDFIIGDDWRVALTVCVALAATYALDRITGTTSWLIVTVAVLVALPASVYLAARRGTQPPSSSSR